MKLIIAEKYSYAKNIMAATGEKYERHMEKANGYCVGQNYIVTWCFGHLYGLQDLDRYPGFEGKWKDTIDSLPYIPHPFEFVPKTDYKTKKTDPGVKKQLKIIHDLVNAPEVNGIIGAGDADREGQLIVDLVLAKMHNKKPVERLWVSDQTPATIRKGLDNLKADSAYAPILNEGLARTYMDWTYGIELSRLATVKSGTLIRVGRVIVPVVQEIVGRDREIRSFVPKDYIKLVSKMNYDGCELTLTSKKTFDVGDPQIKTELAKYKDGKVTSVTRKKAVVKPPKLFSMSALQAYLQSSYSMDEVLAGVQSLYEKGYVSYPRTGAEYLFTSEKDKVRDILRNYPGCELKDAPFNDKKNDGMSHSAIIPTRVIPESLNEKERNIYNAISNRFKAAFCKDDRTVSRTKMSIVSGDETFNVTGDILENEGWGKFEKVRANDRNLPNFTEGQVIPVNFKESKATTTPPKHYSSSELLAWMKNPYKKEEESDVQLGTEATRAGIIETAIKSEYIMLKGKSYTALPKGEFLVDAIDKMNFGIDKRQSLEFADMLVKIREGKMTVDEAMTITENKLRDIFSRAKGISTGTYSSSDVLCKCPKCGGDITENSKAFSCRKCGCVIFKNDRFFNAIGKRMTKTTAKTLFAKGEITLKGLTSKKGKKYDLIVKADFSGKYVNYSTEFPKRKADEFYESSKAYSYKGKTIWKNDRYFEYLGIKLTPKIAKDLLTRGWALVTKEDAGGRKCQIRITADFSGKYVKYEKSYPWNQH